MPQRIWPPVDTYTSEERATILPLLQPETEANKYLYSPGMNDAKKALHSEVPNSLFTAADFETRVNPFPESDPTVPSEPRIQRVPQYEIGKDIENLAEYSHARFSSARRLNVEKRGSVSRQEGPSLLSPLDIKPTVSEDKTGLVHDSTFSPLMLQQADSQAPPRHSPSQKKCACRCALI